MLYEIPIEKLNEMGEFFQDKSWSCTITENEEDTYLGRFALHVTKISEDLICREVLGDTLECVGELVVSMKKYCMSNVKTLFVIYGNDHDKMFEHAINILKNNTF